MDKVRVHGSINCVASHNISCFDHTLQLELWAPSGTTIFLELFGHLHLNNSLWAGFSAVIMVTLGTPSFVNHGVMRYRKISILPYRCTSTSTVLFSPQGDFCTFNFSKRSCAPVFVHLALTHLAVSIRSLVPCSAGNLCCSRILGARAMRGSQRYQYYS
ncbi:unnamed protein product [Tuber aestivum]|uniref:Uncharacterized protein n=1 Tax=Tuber aestivum TaxID=59557 RepID=A0A292PMI2_9PEZI|nr:unnamed protein product [Tuber aestivum]